MYSVQRIAAQFILTYTLILLFLTGLIPVLLNGEELVYKVENRDTLYGLALRYDITVAALKEANSLDREVIRVGEKLIIPMSRKDRYSVKPGDTLSEIALQTGTSVETLMGLNRITPEQLISGMTLELIRSPGEAEIWTVRPGDTLSWISQKFDLSVERIKQINQLKDATILPGQILKLTDPRPQTITVGEGDSLWKISSRYNITIASLKEWNGLAGDILVQGTKLQLYPNILIEEDNSPVKQDNPSRTEPLQPEIRLASLDFKPPLYYSKPTDKITQPDSFYAEEDLDSPRANYKEAIRLLKDFDRAIDELPPLGSSLAGYKIVLDPGHGGIDPGAIVENRDGRGNTVYVVEDEYCYDIALRVYKDLKRHGADVFLTVLSPNHTIRQSPDASLTFVNEKNEVWNNREYNSTNACSSWPVGNREGLSRRVEMADIFFRSFPREKTLFVSIHADNQPYAGEGTVVLYHPDEEKKESGNLAEFMTAYLGLGSSSHSQELRVLNQNPAGAAVLIEIRNLAYPNNSWAIRNEELRQNDADRIVNALTGYAVAR